MSQIGLSLAYLLDPESGFIAPQSSARCHVNMIDRQLFDQLLDRCARASHYRMAIFRRDSPPQENENALLPSS